MDRLQDLINELNGAYKCYMDPPEDCRIAQSLYLDMDKGELPGWVSIELTENKMVLTDNEDDSTPPIELNTDGWMIYDSTSSRDSSYCGIDNDFDRDEEHAVIFDTEREAIEMANSFGDWCEVVKYFDF